MGSTNILVVEDDQTLNALICQNLEQEGHNIKYVFDGESGESLAIKENFDLVLLDVMLPKLDGFEVLNRLRQKKQTPVLMLTAKGGEQDRICGFRSGADDYLIKPFNMAELTLRIEAILRRTRGSSKPKTHISCGNISLDPISGKVEISKESINFTPIEFDLLRALIENPSEVLSKADLYQSVLCREFSRYDRTLDMHISKIRKKITSAGMPVNTIRTVRGQGYSFEAN